jgi:serine/threonine-protein kinase
MSPEQCRGGEGDERSDIYSLAIVLYELLGGAPPFTAETEYDLIQAQITTTPAPLVPRVAGVSPTLEAAILKALAKKPEQRFETMRAFSDALGATALRPDATGMIRNATHLIEAKEEPAQAPARTGAFDIVKSRLLGFSRGWTALGGGSKAGIAAGVLALLAGGAYLAKPDGDGTSAPALSSPIGRALTLSDLRLAVAGSAAEAIRAGDFDLVSNGIKTQLLEPVRKLADAGNAEAQFVQGMLLSETPGHIDRQKAFAAFTQSANQNYAEAQAVLGSLYQDGQTPEGRNLQKAAEWYERAAERGNGKAAFWLGCYDQFGWGGRSVNPQKAIADYSKAIAGHYPKATEALQAMSGGGARSPCK